MGRTTRRRSFRSRLASVPQDAATGRQSCIRAKSRSVEERDEPQVENYRTSLPRAMRILLLALAVGAPLDDLALDYWGEGTAGDGAASDFCAGRLLRILTGAVRQRRRRWSHRRAMRVSPRDRASAHTA